MARWKEKLIPVVTKDNPNGYHPGFCHPSVPGLAVTECWERRSETDPLPGTYMITHIGSGMAVYGSQMSLRVAKKKVLALRTFADWTLPSDQLKSILEKQGWRASP